jgi:hypothetical protein
MGWVDECSTCHLRWHFVVKGLRSRKRATDRTQVPNGDHRTASRNVTGVGKRRDGTEERLLLSRIDSQVVGRASKRMTSSAEEERTSVSAGTGRMTSATACRSWRSQVARRSCGGTNGQAGGQLASGRYFAPGERPLVWCRVSSRCVVCRSQCDNSLDNLDKDAGGW